MESRKIEMLRSFYSRLDQHLAVDLRALGFFRLALGCLLAVEFALRMTDAHALYSGNGVLPLDALKQLPQMSWPWALSLNALSDSPAWQLACMGLGLGASILLAIGWRSSWVAPALLILLHSIQARNPWTNYGADKLLFLMLLWGSFLPLDRFYRLYPGPRSRRRNDPVLLSSWAAWGLRLQVCVMYLFSVFRKNGDTWFDGSALRDTLEIDQFALPLALWMKTLPTLLLKILTWTTLLVELLAPCLILARNVRARWVGLGCLFVLQFLFWMTLDIGIFPFVSTLALLPHLPGSLWNTPRGRVPLLHLKSEIHKAAGWQRVAGYLLAWMLVWNVVMTWQYPDTLKNRMPSWLGQGISLLRMDQYWGMFSPNPMVHDGWYVFLAEREDGSQFDLLDPDRAILFGKPESVLALFPGDRWKEFMMMLYDYPSQAFLWEKVVHHFQDRHTQRHPLEAPVRQVSVYYMMEETLSEGIAPVERELLWPRSREVD
ncbi:MAG: HTTM domain-containing protein [Verrucomicrobiota bacterium]|nr:HTTM domain-containing protein [Verrucomicrobiota bacterium]